MDSWIDEVYIYASLYIFTTNLITPPTYVLLGRDQIWQNNDCLSVKKSEKDTDVDF